MKLLIKNNRLLLLLPALATAVALLLSSCSVHTHSNRSHKHRVRSEKKIPPGQHKKMHGDKSARDYAPGHQKGKKKR